ncbi:hypothetical protein EGK_12171 [Macaca mulatta]|uniref:Uncharacterized protein n=1 Tax=Macaca mulatta TaxID=9544 RepID=G7MK00_MACMU|nr:hypothetical protein EGK_12171 [Macaca mulatta]
MAVLQDLVCNPVHRYSRLMRPQPLGPSGALQRGRVLQARPVDLCSCAKVLSGWWEPGKKGLPPLPVLPRSQLPELLSQPETLPPAFRGEYSSPSGKGKQPPGKSVFCLPASRTTSGTGGVCEYSCLNPFYFTPQWGVKRLKKQSPLLIYLACQSSLRDTLFPEARRACRNTMWLACP